MRRHAEMAFAADDFSMITETRQLSTLSLLMISAGRQYHAGHFYFDSAVAHEGRHADEAARRELFTLILSGLLRA